MANQTIEWICFYDRKHDVQRAHRKTNGGNQALFLKFELGINCAAIAGYFV